MSVKRTELENYLDTVLNISEFQDYGPNGLQIEGNAEIKTIAFAVSATTESINEAIRLGADTLIVHHGLFWKHQPAKPIIGSFANRVKPLITHNINLFAYHLPLDAHATLGNAAQVANIIGMKDLIPFGSYRRMPLGIQGNLNTPITAKKLQEQLAKDLNHSIILSSPDEAALITSIGIITGGANNEWTEALDQNLDAYLTGEISEYNWHDAKEAGIHYFACGHHATERFGVQALASSIKSEFNSKKLTTHFIDSENPA